MARNPFEHYKKGKKHEGLHESMTKHMRKIEEEEEEGEHEHEHESKEAKTKRRRHEKE